MMDWFESIVDMLFLSWIFWDDEDEEEGEKKVTLQNNCNKSLKSFFV